jgi:hypothetical protein
MREQERRKINKEAVSDDDDGGGSRRRKNFKRDPFTLPFSCSCAVLNFKCHSSRAKRV